MSGRRRRARRTLGASLCMLAVTLLLGTGRCESRADADGRAEDGVRALLDRRADAVLVGNQEGFLATVDPRSGDYRRRQRTVAANLASLRPVSWSYDLGRLTVDGRRAEAEVELRYRLTGHDRTPVRAPQRFRLQRRDGRWRLAGETADSTRHLWEQGPLHLVRAEHSLVLGTVERATLRRIAARAERAVPAVSRAWPESWPRHTVVLVPGSVRDMAELLDGDASTYQGIAAVTTGSQGGTPGRWKRIVVNRQAFGLLSDRGRQVVMTHETAHVATRAHTGEATPLWLSEGLADWFGYRDAGTGPGARGGSGTGTGTRVDPTTAAPVLTRDVRAGNVPRQLPADAAFRFTSGPDPLARAYEGAWLACLMIADRWGPDRLAALYVAVGKADGPRAPAVDGALRDVLGVGTAEFTRMWRSALRQRLAGP